MGIESFFNPIENSRDVEKTPEHKPDKEHLDINTEYDLESIYEEMKKNESASTEITPEYLAKLKDEGQIDLLDEITRMMKYKADVGVKNLNEQMESIARNLEEDQKKIAAKYHILNHKDLEMGDDGEWYYNNMKVEDYDKFMSDNDNKDMYK